MIVNNTGGVLNQSAIRPGYNSNKILITGNRIVNNGISVVGSGTTSYNENIKIINNSIYNGYIGPFLTKNLVVKGNTIKNYLPGSGQPASMIHSGGYNLNMHITGNDLGNDDAINYGQRAISLTPANDSGVTIQGNNLGLFTPWTAGRTWYVAHGYPPGLIMKNNHSLESQVVNSANPLVIPAFGNLITVNGTTSFSYISHADYESYPGRVITLYFTDALTITSGANLVLNGNFVTAAGSTLTLCFTDTTDTGVWHEVSRNNGLNVSPNTDLSGNIGAAAKRFLNIYTSHLSGENNTLTYKANSHLITGYTDTPFMYIDYTGRVGVGVGTSPDASAKLDVGSTTSGFLPPRMTTTQKNAISSPAEGLMVYDLTLHKLSIYTGAAWQTVTSAP